MVSSLRQGKGTLQATLSQYGGTERECDPEVVYGLFSLGSHDMAAEDNPMLVLADGERT